MTMTSIPLENGRVPGKKTRAVPRTAPLDATTGKAPDALAEELERVRMRIESLGTQDLLKYVIETAFEDRIAVVSSFGSESAVLLHLVAEVDPTTPVLFLNTGKLFGETLRFRDRLQSKLGLTDLRVLYPHPKDESAHDPDGTLWNSDTNACCHVRKVLPLERGLRGFDAQITGRKRFQTQARSGLERIEVAPDGRFKINPLADWDLAQLNAYMDAHKLPRHPLVKDGYLSIGCMPCTERVKPDGDYRSGRWSGESKEECGIHGPSLIDGDGI